MKRTLVTVALTLAVAVPLSASAAVTARHYLNSGDTAYLNNGDTACTVIRTASGNAFRCRVGGDYRAKYGAIINGRSVAVTRYSNFDRYTVVYRRNQSPIP